MSLDDVLQPDQDAALWDRHVEAYESVFEPLTNQFAAQALAAFGPLAGRRLIDIGAGTGGAALIAARSGAVVTAIDASASMAARIAARAAASGLAARIAARQMDAAALDMADGTFDLGLSCFGIILLADPLPALRAARRVLTARGILAIVTWTEPQAYELATRLRQAIEAVRGPAPPTGPRPAQLRYAEPAALSDLLIAGGFAAPRIERLTGHLEASGALALAQRLDIAPGLAALLDGLGPDRPAVLGTFVDRLVADQGHGAVALGAVAHVAFARHAP